MGRFLPVEANVAGACEARVFEAVIAKDDIELVLNLLGGGIAVPSGEYFYAGRVLVRVRLQILCQIIL